MQKCRKLLRSEQDQSDKIEDVYGQSLITINNGEIIGSDLCK